MYWRCMNTEHRKIIRRCMDELEEVDSPVEEFEEALAHGYHVFKSRCENEGVDPEAEQFLLDE